ncbi:MAG: hypothetical protein AB1427_14960 [Thermodesulfobacteriota bacterium]
MKRPILPIDLNHIKTKPLAERKSLVKAGDAARPWRNGASFKDFLDSLPNILAGSQVRKVIAAMAAAAKSEKVIILGMGAHVIKVGLNPVVVDLMERGIVSAVAMNGAGIIHDFELAMTGRTSEDVSASLKDGAFGMATETGAFLCEAIQYAGHHEIGIGEAVGKSIIGNALPFAAKSILAAGARLDIPVTVHVAVGTDIIHMHPQFDPAAAGEATHRDFRTFAGMVAGLEGGVYLNVGSAVILPEIFLKAVSLARNLGYRLDSFTTVNMDFIAHYRPLTNVVRRPTAQGGQGVNLIGHHEILLPLIAAGVIEEIEK